MINYKELSLDEFTSIKWRLNKMNLSNYLDLECECAQCGRINKFSNYLVELEGGGMQLLIKCNNCNKKSIIKIKGFFKIKIETLYKVPLIEDDLKFPNCKICNSETSLTGNLTNMELTGINDSNEFNTKYGMMCSNHAQQLTKQLMQEKGLTEVDFRKAYEKVEQAIQRKIFFDGILK